MGRAIDRQILIDLIINAKRTDPETGSFTEHLADYLLGHGVTLPQPSNEAPPAGGRGGEHMMDFDKLIKDLLENSDPDGPCIEDDLMRDAADALSTLQAEVKRLKSLLGEGGQDLWSKENQRADRLEAENEKLRAELEQVKMYHYELVTKPNCNTCADKDCKYRPIPGDIVRANCPLWRCQEEG